VAVVDPGAALPLDHVADQMRIDARKQPGVVHMPAQPDHQMREPQCDQRYEPVRATGQQPVDREADRRRIQQFRDVLDASQSVGQREARAVARRDGAQQTARRQAGVRGRGIHRHGVSTGG
jgi:hypothetical protein